MDIEVRVCDIESVVGEATSRYTITMPSGKEEVLDLCERHAEPIMLLLARRAGATVVPVQPTKLRPRPATPPPSRSGRTGPRRTVTTVADIERSKRS